MTTNVGIFIFHRDFRIIDNVGLNAFCELCDSVVPVFIFTHKQIDNDKNNYKSIHSVRFMIEGLSDLQESLNGNLYTFYGNIIDVLRE
jgi:deoxyribodipyrimidine photolyase